MVEDLRIVGAAFPRTGTMSVKRALESLGIGCCYHMHELFLNPGHVPHWEAARRGRMPDWRELLAGFGATLDAPACLYWQELARAYPRARVLLLRRDPESWYESMRETTYPVLAGPRGESDPALRLVRALLLEAFFEGRFEDRAFAVARYAGYCRNVIAEVPAERLLVYEAAQGWEPLCRLVGREVPDQPFPRKNTRQEFRARNRRE